LPWYYDWEMGTANSLHTLASHGEYNKSWFYYFSNQKNRKNFVNACVFDRNCSKQQNLTLT